MRQRLIALGAAVTNGNGQTCWVMGHTHTALTRFFHAQWLGQQVVEATAVKFGYGDGSVGKSIALNRLTTTPIVANENGGIFRLATLSARHLDYDEICDMYLLRHAETLKLTNAAVEELAFKRMKEFLVELPINQVGRLEILQTGLEPLVLGMYRALREYMEACSTAGAPSPSIVTHFTLHSLNQAADVEWI